jgi:hypothetical protein
MLTADTQFAACCSTLVGRSKPRPLCIFRTIAVFTRFASSLPQELLTTMLNFPAAASLIEGQLPFIRRTRQSGASKLESAVAVDGQESCDRGHCALRFVIARTDRT